MSITLRSAIKFFLATLFVLMMLGRLGEAENKLISLGRDFLELEDRYEELKKKVEDLEWKLL